MAGPAGTHSKSSSNRNLFARGMGEPRGIQRARARREHSKTVYGRVVCESKEPNTYALTSYLLPHTRSGFGIVHPRSKTSRRGTSHTVLLFRCDCSYNRSRTQCLRARTTASNLSGVISSMDETIASAALATVSRRTTPVKHTKASATAPATWSVAPSPTITTGE
jgi:hypothetical protein